MMLRSYRVLLKRVAWKRTFPPKPFECSLVFNDDCNRLSINTLRVTNTWMEKCSPCFAFVRCLGSSSGSGVDKDIVKNKVDLVYPEQKISLYTCENVYEKWKKDKKFISIPSSGVYCEIIYVDTSISADGTKQAAVSAPTVLCIHGMPGNYSVFSHLITYLGQRGIRVIVPNFPDTLYIRGKHKNELFRHSVEEKTQVFKDFLKALNIAELEAIVAHSSAIYPALRLALDPNLNVKSQALFNTGGHKKTVTMKPYWIVWICSHLYLNPLGRKFILKCGKFIMNHILRTPIKDDNLNGIMVLAITMVFSEYWKTKEQFQELVKKEFPTLLCFSEDDKVVERELTYEVISLLGASRENISFYDKDVSLREKGIDKKWLKLLSFEEGSHYVFRKHPEICNKEVFELLQKRNCRSSNI